VEFKNIEGCYLNRKTGIIGEHEMQKFSVIIPLIKDEEGIKVVFEVRAKTLRHQPGEISFPGGKIENNETTRAAAIRETSEELGIPQKDILVLGEEDILVTQHNRIIYSYVAKINDIEKIRPSASEVDHVFCVPLKFFLENNPTTETVKVITVPQEDFPYEDIASGSNYKWLEGNNKIYFYKYRNYTIWGLTARILYNFVNTISEMEMEI
jgi:peroxisomal coenzyme A diphosphatase NUDT7